MTRKFLEHVCTEEDPKNFHIIKKDNDETAHWLLVFEDIEGEWIAETIYYCFRCGVPLHVSHRTRRIEMLPPPGGLPN